MSNIGVAPLLTHHLAAVWFADIVGFTDLSARDERSAMALVSLLQLCARRAVGQCDGRLVKFIGDEAMAEFGSTDASVRAALQLKTDFQSLADRRAVPAFLRIGIHVGEVVSSEGDIYGDGVNTASRIQREARPGEVLVSEEVRRHLQGRSEFALEDRGERKLRGLDGPRRLYAVALVESDDREAVTRQESVVPDSWAIAVLPFVDISAGHDNEYFSDGMTEELIHSLSRVEGLRVASRTSSYSFKGRNAGIEEIAEALHVNVVLEGSVRKIGSRVRVTPLLVDAANGYQLWTDNFERELDDVFDLQETISGAIVDALQVKLGAPERITREHTHVSLAYDEYLKGRYHWNRHTPKDFNKSIVHYERAIAADPEYALAWAGLADSYITMGAVFLGRPGDLYPRAREAARKALDLDPHLAAAQAALAEVQLRYDWDWDAAERGFRRALALDPSNADARYRYGNFLRDMGRFDEAIVEIRRAQGMDPRSLPISAALAGVFYYARRYDEAIEECRRALEQEPRFYNASFYMAVSYLGKGMANEALCHFERVRELAGFPGAIAGIVVGCDAAGRGEEARLLLADLRSLAENGEASAFLVAWAYLGLGDRDEAFRWFDIAIEERTSWFTSLRVEPSFAELQEDPRFQRLLARVGFPTSDQVRHNLPAQPTSIVGRQPELGEVRALLMDRAARIVTLVGPGGVGKTRLAVEACFRALDGFADGIRFIPLSAVDPPEILLSALARAMGIVEVGPDPRESLVTELRDRRVLLVLDGFEHLLPAASLVAELLGSLPDLRVMVTSQATLRIRGERVFEVPPLGLPGPELRERSTADLERYGAVALFLDRMEAIKPTHVPGPEDLDAIVEICRRLDGLPLAIELAAARLRLMSAPALLGRLEDRFDLLVQGPRDMPQRHQTLRAVCDWSYGLLDPREQTMFRIVAAFAGGCSLEAAEDLLGESVDEAHSQGPPTGRGALDLLASLAEKSLVRQVETGEGEPRFQMLETIRQYGLELLDSLGETPTIRRRQLEYFLALALRAEPVLTGPDQTEWLDRLDRDHENVTALMDWALEEGEVEIAVRLGSAMWWFFWLRGHFAEMRTRFALALQRGTDLPRSLRANLLVASGAIATMDGEGELAARFYEQAVELERDREDRRGLPRALRSLASSLINLGRYEESVPLYEDALALDREFGNPLGECAGLRGLAKAALYLGELDRADGLYAEAISLARSVGDRHYVANTLAGLGDVARHRGRLEDAQGLYQEALDLCRMIGSQPGIASALQHLATIALASGNPDRSEGLYREALEILRRLNNKRAIAFSLAGLGASAVERQDAERGVRILGVAERLAGSAGAVLPPHEQRWWKDRFAAAGEALGPTRSEELLAEGRSLSLEAGIKLALEGGGGAGRASA